MVIGARLAWGEPKSRGRRKTKKAPTGGRLYCKGRVPSNERIWAKGHLNESTVLVGGVIVSRDTKEASGWYLHEGLRYAGKNNSG